MCCRTLRCSHRSQRSLGLLSGSRDDQARCLRDRGVGADLPMRIPDYAGPQKVGTVTGARLGKVSWGVFVASIPVAHHTELMTRVLSPADIRSFAARRWNLVADEKLRFIVERFEAAGIIGSRSAARRLRERWLALHPDGASDADRETDLKAHVALKEKLDRVHNAAVRR